MVPKYLSCRETSDNIASICLATGRDQYKNKMSSALLSAILPDGTSPIFCSTVNESVLVNDLTKSILCGDWFDSITDLDLLTDMNMLNIWGNTNQSKFTTFLKAAARVIELDEGSGVHYRRHVSVDRFTTTNVSYGVSYAAYQ